MEKQARQIKDPESVRSIPIK